MIKYVAVLLMLCASFAAADWKSDADANIEQFRKRDIALMVLSPNGQTLEGVEVEVKMLRHAFPFGASVNTPAFSSIEYQKFFLEYFNWAVFASHTHWGYNNSGSDPNVTSDYFGANQTLKWLEEHDIPVRGHCIYYGGFLPQWVQNIPYGDRDQLRAALEGRMYDIVPHFKGKLAHWDVINETAGTSDSANYFRNRLDTPENPVKIRNWMFETAHALDPDVKLFMNEFGPIADGDTQWNALTLTKNIANAYLADGLPLDGIGAQSHLPNGFDPATCVARINSLATVGLPIWITEFDIGIHNSRGGAVPSQLSYADQMEDYMRLTFGHPAVHGFLFWTWGNLHNSYDLENPTVVGQRYLDLVKGEWATNLTLSTNSQGKTNFRAFHGTYEITLTPAIGRPNVLIVDFPVASSVLNVTLVAEDVCQASDLDGDCVTNVADLSVFASEWLTKPEGLQ